MGVCKGVKHHTEQRNINQNHNKKLLVSFQRDISKKTIDNQDY